MSWVPMRSLAGLMNGVHLAPRDIGLSSERRVAHSICVASGKGGTGKSIVAASLAAVYSRRGRVLLVDADLGAGNAHILQNANPERSLVDVAAGLRDIDEVLTACGPHIDLLAAGSGVPHMAGLSGAEMRAISRGLAHLEPHYEYCVVDSAAGLSDQTLAFAAASDIVLIVTTPDLTAMTDAYAFYKVLSSLRTHQRVGLLVNRAASAFEADSVAQRVCDVARRFLGHAPPCFGWLPEDICVRHAVNNRRPVVREDPHAEVALGLERVAQRLEMELRELSPAGLGHSLSGS